MRESIFNVRIREQYYWNYLENTESLIVWSYTPKKIKGEKLKIEEEKIHFATNI